MRILYCKDEINSGVVDSCFTMEADVATQCGLNYGLIDFNAVRGMDGLTAVRSVAHSETIETAIYRGWMLTPSEYELLFYALEQKNILLINSPIEYLHCHWFPNSYQVIEKQTPLSVWIPTERRQVTISDVMQALRPFGTSPVIVKDYVKSQKHEWDEACFIPSASDAVQVERVVERFLDLQDVDFQGGLVFREFVEFEPLGRHPKSGMPITLEYRLFVLDGTVISESPYWDTETSADRPSTTVFDTVLKNVKSRFFSCDVAKTTKGEWLIVELGDGQVAGLPERCDIDGLYSTLSSRITDGRTS